MLGTIDVLIVEEPDQCQYLIGGVCHHGQLQAALGTEPCKPFLAALCGLVVAVQGKVKRLKESVSMLDEVSWDCERTCRGTRFTHLLCTQQVVDFALDSGAKITDVDSRN